MFDLDAIRKRAQQASEHAADSIRQTMEKSEALTLGPRRRQKPPLPPWKRRARWTPGASGR